MKNYLLVFPVLLACSSLIFDVYFVYIYTQALLDEFEGVGGAQWQIAFAFFHWPIIASAGGFILALFINRKHLKIYLSSFIILSVTPIGLFLLVKNGYY